MSEMRAVAWDDVGADEYIRAGHPLWDQTVAEMEAEGFKPVWERAHHWSTFAVAVFRRRPPTPEELSERLQTMQAAGQALFNFLGSPHVQMKKAAQDLCLDLRIAWKDAVERADANT